MKRFFYPLFPILFFAIVSIIITWPLVLTWDTMIPVGMGGDAWVHQWTFWWLKKALLAGENPLFTHQLFYPGGVSLTSHNVAWFNFSLWFPLQMVWGNTVAYGLMFLIIFTLNGCSCYWLVRELTGSFAAALVAGVVYATWPYLVSQQGHPNMPIIMWLPLALLYLTRTFKEKSARAALLTALFIALTGIGRWQLLILFGIGFGSFFLYHVIKNKTYRTRQMLLLYGLIGVVAISLMAPLGWPVLEAQLTRSNPDEIFVKEYFQGSDLLSYVVPNSHMTLWRWLVYQLPQSIQFHNDRVDFIGHITLLLAGAGVWLRWSKARPWVLMALIYFVLALGSDLRLGNAIYSWFPLPYRLVEDFSLIRVIRYPHRFNTFLSLPVAVMAAYGLLGLKDLLPKSLSSQAIRTLLVGLVVTLIIGEHWMYPYRMSRVDVPEWYQTLTQETDDFGLLGLPLHHRGFDKNYMRFQMTHGKPLAQGHISRPTSDAYKLLQSTPFLALIQEKNQFDPAQGDITHQLGALADANIRYLILHKEYATEKQMTEWREWLLYSPHYEDDEVVVYSTAPRYNMDYTLPSMLTEQIGLIRAETNLEPSGREFFQAGTIQATAEWGTVTKPDADLTACLYLLAQNSHGEDQLSAEQVSEDENNKACFVLGGGRPSSQWATNELLREQYNYQLSPFIQAGPYRLSLGLEQATAPVGTALDLGTFEIKAIPRAMDAPAIATSVAATWGDQLRLHGYDLRLTKSDDGDVLQLSLLWQAVQRMPQSYKFFVHLLDANGNKITQHDGVPRNWSYPTTWWEAGEYVIDIAELKIGSEQRESLGRYQNSRLNIGVYDEATGARLPGFSAQGQPLPEQILQIEIINELDYND